MLLRSARPIGKLFSESGRRVGTCRWPLDTKQLSAAILPVRRWNSFMFDGNDMSSTAFILSGFASIPWLLTIKPKNFPVETPKAHLAGLNFRCYSFKIWNASAR